MSDDGQDNQAAADALFADTDDAEANKFIRRLRHLKGQVTRQRNRLAAETNPSTAFLETLQIRIQEFGVKYSENCDRLIEIDMLPEAAENLDLAIEDLQHKVRTRLNRPDLSRPSAPLRESDQSRSSLPKLPELQMPRFSGQRKDWLNYRKYISEMIEPRHDLTDLHKYHYLDTSLSGTAKNVISSSGSNFVTAWESLKNEYDNNTALKYEIMEQIYDVRTPVSRNADSLSCFVDTVQSNLNQLSTLNVSTSTWDLILTFHLKRRLDLESLMEFERQRTVDTDVTVTELLLFLKKRVKLLMTTAKSSPLPKGFNPQASSTPQDNKHAAGGPGKQTRRDNTFQAQAQVQQVSCPYCTLPHPLYQCWKAKKLPSEVLKKFVFEKELCFNCLRAGHTSAKCPSKGACLVCHKQGHHTLLHDACVTASAGASTNSSLADSESTPKPASTTSFTSSASTPASYDAGHTSKAHHTTGMALESQPSMGVAILATAIVHLKNRNGVMVPCRAFLDSGSTVSFITTELASQLRLPKVSVHTIIDGINGTETTNKQQITAQLSSLHGNFQIEVDLLLTRKITGDLPQQKILLTDLQFPLSELADPAYDTPGRIDLLLGCDIFYAVICGEKTRIQDNLWAYPSQLGVIIAGRASPTNRIYTYVAIEALRRQVQRFWEVENLQNGSHFSLEEKAAENHFVDHIHRRPDRHYEVALPFKSNILELGNTAARAKILFLASEKRLQQQVDKQQHYIDFMSEMLAMGHMKRSCQAGYFVPHHLISRPSSTTTKHRVVFNASFKSDSGYSLNDMLLVGPTIQDDVFCHLIRWRELPVATTADIEKMYRMIFVRQEDQKFQQVWWRADPSQPLLSYALTTVTYGTASAPFQATRCLKKLAEDEHNEFCDVTNELEKHFYMDDYTSSFCNSSEAARTKHRLSQLLLSGGFNCRKWHSNDPALNSDEVDTNSATVLGVKWNKLEDTIEISFVDMKLHQVITKCTVLSETAQLFDPLGLAAPVVVLAKLFIQKLWLDNLDWTEELPSHLAEEWMTFRDSLQQMGPIPVSRPLLLDIAQPFTLHGFADASTKAYGACVYFVVPGRSILVSSKSRVAPTKMMTIPRLELAAALLLAQLVEKVRACCRSKPKQVVCWTDSQITFHRIKSVSSRYTTFVAVRVAEIQQLTQPDDWRFIPGELNPADLVSRGVPPASLLSCHRWWYGPEFLLNGEPWPEWVTKETTAEDSEAKKEVHLAMTRNSADTLPFIVSLANNKSAIKVVVNIVVHIVRFFINLLKAKASKYYIRGNLTLQEREDSLMRCYRSIQCHYFPEDYKRLCNKCPLLKSSSLLALNPYLDDDGVMRVGGRLALTSTESQRQVLLPNSSFSTLLLEDIHRKNLHAGPQALLAFCRQTYWVIGGLSVCRNIVHKCMICFKQKPRLLGQIMADIHPDRSRPESSFEVVGVDYAGPFLYKPLVRSRVQCKAYVALFTCYKYRCTHMEVVHDLTTTSFMNALRRFVSRRGVPRKMYSDNATNLTGGRRELAELREMLLSQATTTAITEYCNENRMQWIHIPARSPHFGGLWEAMVKQFKHHFNRALADKYLRIDELQTLVTQIEAILNSRPLTSTSSSAEDFKALTPGHFLMLKPVNLLPEPTWKSSNVTRLQSWQLIQYTVCCLADQFKKLYFNELQRRAKWRTPQPNVSTGTLVLLQDDNLPPTKWRLGRIIEVFKGSDNMVRSVAVKTSTGEVTRAVQRVAPLPLDH